LKLVEVLPILRNADMLLVNHARTCNACMENLFSEVEKAITEKV
jgi:hypothetical protein